MPKLFKLPENTLKYFVAAILLAIPLYPKFPFLRIPGTYVSIRFEDFLLAILALVCLLEIWPKIKELFNHGIEKSILIYLGVGLVSLISAVFLTQSVEIHIVVLHWLRRIEYLIPFFAGVLLFKKGNHADLLNFYLKVIVLEVFLLFFYGLGQKYLSWPVIITQNEEYAKGIALRWIPGSHINSTFAGHYDLATYLVMMLPILATSFFILKGKITKAILGLNIFSGLWLMANAVSRISVVSYLIGSVVALALAKKYKAIPVILLISFVFFGFSADLKARYMRIIEVTKEKIIQTVKTQTQAYTLDVFAQEVEGTTSGRVSSNTPTPKPVEVFEDRSTSIRFNVEWPRAIRAFRKNPLLGTGYSSITLATDNDYLRLLGETGILGLLAFLLIFVRIGLLIKKALPLTNHFSGINLAYLSGFVGCLIGVFINAFFIDIFEASKFAILFWLFMGIAVSMIRYRKYGYNN
jgi:hypothetical protein